MIYLDHNATTPVAPRVREAMAAALADLFGNPSSSHPGGRAARAAVDRARGQVAGLLGCRPQEIVLTSGGSEANNHALKGAAWRRRADGRHLVISSVEHPAVTAVCDWLAAEGWRVTAVPVDGDGLVRPAAVERALTPDTVLVSVMLANNEVGALQPVRELAALTRPRGIWLHTDAAQAVGKIPVDVADLGVDLLSLAGHKFYAPKGVGALYVREGVELVPLIHGAAHEAGRRAGTENVAGVVGLGEACALAAVALPDEVPRQAALRDRLQQRLLAAFPAARVHAAGALRLPGTLSIGFPGADANAVLAAVADRVAASAGSACHADGATVSGVLAAMGVPPAIARGTLRLSLGRTTTETDVDQAADVLIAAIGNAGA